MQRHSLLSRFLAMGAALLVLLSLAPGSLAGSSKAITVVVSATITSLDPSVETHRSAGAIQNTILWVAVALLGAVSFAIVALNRGEAVNAAWLVVAAVCIYFIAYRFYGLFVAKQALGVDGARQTPAVRHNDGLDYVPTNRYVLFGHHFAAIAGPEAYSSRQPFPPQPHGKPSASTT